MLFACSIGGAVLAQRDQFTQDYRICPSHLRLEAMKGVQVRIGKRDQLIVEWDPLNPDAWKLPGTNQVVTVVTVAPRNLKQDTVLATTRSTFDNVDYTNHVWTFRVAVTDRDTVISEIVERTFPFGDDRSRADSDDSGRGNGNGSGNGNGNGSGNGNGNGSGIPVRFGAAAYRVDEGGSVTVSVRLSSDPERTVQIPLATLFQGRAGSEDFGDIPASITFNSGETEKTFTVSAADDDDDDDDESVVILFGSLPPGIARRAPDRTTISVNDNDDPAVTISFTSDTYTVVEDATGDIVIQLNADPERSITIPLTTTLNGGAGDDDFDGVPDSITFNRGETRKSFSFIANEDSEDDDDESVTIDFGTLPAGVSEGANGTTTVSIGDNDDPTAVEFLVTFGSSHARVREGTSIGVGIYLNKVATGTIPIPLTVTHEGGATSDDYSIPTTVTFPAGQSGTSVNVSITDDSVDDDGENLILGFGTLPAGVGIGAVNTTTKLFIQDNDDPYVVASFAADSYTAPEGSDISVTMNLDADPERRVDIPVTETPFGGASIIDYVAQNHFIFYSGETSATITVTALDDTFDDDGEGVQLGMGTLPSRVSAGTVDTTDVEIADDDFPSVTAGFAAETYTVTEGKTVTVTVSLSADPEQTVTLPLTAHPLNGATASDFSGVPASLTFNSGDTSASFDFQATTDSNEEEGEAVNIVMGNPSTKLLQISRRKTTISITDSDGATGQSSQQTVRTLAREEPEVAAALSVRNNPAVFASFGDATYPVIEGGSVVVTVQLDPAPEHPILIPLIVTLLGGASANDYRGVPDYVSFNAGQTIASFNIQTVDNATVDQGKGFRLGFGPLPTGVSAGADDSATVQIDDDDSPEITVGFGTATYTVAEDSSVGVTVSLSADPQRAVTIPLLATLKGGATANDHGGIPVSLEFRSGETTKTIPIHAVYDTFDEFGESIVLRFGDLPQRVSAGATPTTTVAFAERIDTALGGDVDADFGTAAKGPTQAVLNWELTFPVVAFADSKTNYYLLIRQGSTLRFEARWNPSDPTETIRPVHQLHGTERMTSPSICQVAPIPLASRSLVDESSGPTPAFLSRTPKGSAGGVWDIYAIATWGTVPAGTCHVSNPAVPSIAISYDPVERRIHQVKPNE